MSAELNDTVLKQRMATLVELAGESGEFFPSAMTVLDHLLLGVVQEESAPSLAMAGYKNMLGGFHNFNEIRVSHVRELVDAMEGVPQAEEKAQRIIDALQFIFETTYAYDLESMKKKPVRQAQKQLSKIPGATRFAVQAVVQRALAGPGSPLDSRTRRVFVDLGFAQGDDSLDALSEVLERITPPESATAVALFVSELADDPTRLKQTVETLSTSTGATKSKAMRPVKKATA